MVAFRARARLCVALSALLCTPALAQDGQCDVEGTCTYQASYQGNMVSFDLRGLCNAGQDYSITDNVGHTYYANICGTAGTPCRPAGWQNQYQYGRVIQSWGAAPDCNAASLNCMDERTGAPVCCTADCQVVAVQQPMFSFVVPGDATSGIRLTYLGETPTASDPYQCPLDPETNSPVPRVTHMEFYCDPSQTGFANLYGVDQNATDSCEYTLMFKTAQACVNNGNLSGGWVFIILLLSATAVYIFCGLGWGYKFNKKCQFPNKSFWIGLEGLIFDGMLFVARGFKKGGYRKSLATEPAEAPRDTYVDSISSTATTGSYQDSGRPGKAAAYHDL